MGLEEERKRCSNCGVEHPLSFFRKTRRKTRHGYVTEYRSVCKECESKERIAKRDGNPFRPKARSTLLYHAKREGMAPKQFSHKFGITLDYLEMLFRDAWILHEVGSKCHSCSHPFKHDLSDFQLDKIFPDLPPTRSNVRVICKTCNVAKGKKGAIEFDLESIEYDRNKEAVKKGVQFGLPVESKASGKQKPAIYRAGEQVKLF